MALREILTHFGFSVDDSKLKQAGKSVDGMASRMKQALGVFAAGAIVSGVASFVNDLQGAADQLTDTSAQLGVSAQELQRWQLAAKLSGAEAGDLATGLRNVSKYANDAKGKAEFKKLGIDLKGTNGEAKNATQLMGDIGLEIAKIKSPTERTAKMLEVFGKSGAKLGPIFAEGEEGLSKLLGRLDELGGGLGDDALDVLAKSGDATDELSVSFLSLKSRLAVSLFPALTSGIAWLTKTFAWLSRAAKGTKLFQSAVVVMGGAAVIAIVAVYGAFIPILLVVAAAILIVEDLWTAWNGGDSIVGRVIDSIFGIGATQKTIQSIKIAWSGLNEEMSKSPTIAGKARAAFDYAADGAQESGIETLDSFRDLYDALRSDESSWGDIGIAWVWALVAPFRDFGAKLWPYFRDGSNAAWKAFDDWATRGFAVAVDFVAGIARGIASGAGELYTAVENLATDMIKKIKDKFGARSPARKLYPVGSSIPQGLGVGIERDAKVPEQAAADVARRTIRAMTPSMELTPGQRASAMSARGGPTQIQLNSEMKANLVFQGGSSADRATVRRGMMEAHSGARDALIADLESVMVPT